MKVAYTKMNTNSYLIMFVGLTSTWTRFCRTLDDLEAKRLKKVTPSQNNTIICQVAQMFIPILFRNGAMYKI